MYVNNNQRLGVAARGALLVLLAVFAGAACAQGTIVLGSQTASNAFPFSYGSGNGRFQHAYSNTELAAASGRLITQIRVYGSTVSPVPTFNNLRVRMAHTTLSVTGLSTNFNTNYSGNLVTVLGPVNYQPTATPTGSNQWYTFTLSTPFLYNGTNNLLIDWSYESRTGTGFTVATATSRTRIYTQGLPGGPLTPIGPGTDTSGNFGIEFTYLNTADGTTIGSNTTADAAFLPPVTDKVLLDASLTAITTSRDLTSITFTKSGTITDAQIAAVTFVTDNNNNGAVDGGDTVLGTGTFASGTITFTGAPLVSVTTGTPVRVLLAGSIASGPATGANVQVTIASSADVTWSGGTDYNVYPVRATSFYVGSATMNMLRGAVAVADGGTDTYSNFAIGTPIPVTYTITNSGNGPLILATGATFQNVSGCTVSVTTAPTGFVAAGSSVTTVITVTASASTLSFDYSIANNDLATGKNPYNWTMNGSAVPADPSANFIRTGGTPVADGTTDNLGSHAFGNNSPFAVGTAATLTYFIVNSGTTPLTLTNPATISSIVGCTVSISLSPATFIDVNAQTSTNLTVTPTATTFSFNYSIANNDPGTGKNPYNFSVTGTATVANPIMEVVRGTTVVADGGSDSLPNLGLSVGNPITYTFRNVGTSNLTLSTVTISGQTNCTVTVTTSPVSPVLQAGFTTTVLSVTPSAATFSFNYSIVNNDPGAGKNPYNFSVSGTAIAAAPNVDYDRIGTVVPTGTTDTIGFGFVVGTATTVTYTIRNTGSGATALTLSGGAITGATGCSVIISTVPAASVATAATTTTVLTVTPSANAFSFTYSITTNVASKNPYTFLVSGTALSPAPDMVMIRGTTVIPDGGTDTLTDLGMSVINPITYTIRNIGTTQLSLGAASITGQTGCTATVTTAPAATTATGNFTTTVITITPSAANFSFSYSIVTNDPGAGKNPYNWSVSGTAVTATPSMNVLRGSVPVPDGGEFIAPVFTVGNANTLLFTIQNVGTATLNLTNPASIGSMTNCNVTITTSPATAIGARGSTTTTLTVTPSAATFSFTWSIANNDPGTGKNPYNFTINGTAQTGGLSGTYVINRAGGAGVDFQDLGDAFDLLELVGVVGPCVFELYDDGGPYISTTSYQLAANATTMVPVAGVNAYSTLIFRAASGESPVLSGSAAQSAFTTSTTGTISMGNISFVTFEGLEIVGGIKFGIHSYTNAIQTDVRIIGCKFHDITGAAIMFYGNASPTNNVIIRNNFIWGCHGDGGTDLSSGIKGLIGARRGGAGWLIEHNTLVNVNGSPATAIFFGGGGTQTIGTIRNNIIYLGHAYAPVPLFWMDTAVGTFLPVSVDRNVVYLTGTATMCINTSFDTWAEWQASGRDTNGLNSDPLLTSIAVGSADLHVTQASPAVGLAVGSMVTTDIDGESRPNGAAADAGADEYYDPGPSVTGVTPNAGPLAGGQSVTITGVNFLGATGVTFGGVAATNLVVVTSTTITCDTPAHAAGAVSVVVTTPAGSNPANSLYTYQAAPTLSGVNPSGGPVAGGTNVTLTGTGFTGASSVTFDGTPATGVVVVSATSITCTTPAHAAGAVSVVVTTPGGQNAANTLFTYFNAPTLSNVNPAGGPAAGGQSVTLTGTNFTGATGVTFGGTAATSVVVVNDTTITCDTPAHASGAVSVIVTNPGGANAANTLYTYFDGPTLSNVSPASGPLTGGQSVTLTGTNFTGATSVTFGGTPATGVTVVSATSITCTTPANSAGAVSVIVTTPGGSNAANTLYTYQPAPTLSNVSPAVGPTVGGQNVTLTGTNFTGATSVTFDGTPATGVVVASATSITCTTPAGAAGSVSVVVTTPSGQNAANALYTYQAAPTLSNVIPSGGPVAGGQNVTLTGTGFTGATSVTFGGAAATGVTVVSATSITCTTPAHAAGTVSVIVTTPGGSNAANSLYTYFAVPSVTNVTPAVGPLGGGQAVTLTGNDFTGATSVTFGGTAATGVTVVSATSITCTTPAHAAGTVSVVVTTPGGSNAANTLYTYQAAPTVSNVSPSVGTTAGGTSVTITGTDFTGASGVTFGGTAATGVTVVSATTITCTTPAHAAGTVSVVVTTPGGSNAANSLYTYQDPPTLSGVSPAVGPITGGQNVTLTGTDFTGATGVTFDGTAATGVTVVSATTITCVTPAHAAGAVSVIVTTPAGTNAANTLYAYQAAPTLATVAPAAGPLTGGQNVTLTGTDFTGATSVTFGGTSATGLTVVSATSITCVTPAHAAGAVSVIVTTPGGQNAANTLYTYQAAPTVTSVTPNTGDVAGGTSVTITGTDFTGATGVTFGGAAATGITVVSATSITCTTPAHAAGAVSVEVTTPGGTNAPNALFTYFVPSPTLSTVSPVAGPAAGGQNVTLTGTNFTGATSVTFGGTAATALVVVNDTTITCTTPAHAVGAVSVIVTTPSGANTPNSAYTYQAAPTVTAVTPNLGTTLGGTSITITGTDFLAATSVTVGGIAATSVVVVSATSITCVTAPNTAGVVSVNVTTPSGTNAANTLYTYVAPPTLSSVTPGFGLITGGTSVTLAGTLFTGATSVTFDGIAATSVIVVSDTSITCVTPAHAAGQVSVIVTTPGGQNAANTLFNYVTSFNADIEVARGATTITDGTFDSLGNVPFGSPRTVTYTITNNGTATLNLTGSPSLVTTTVGTAVTSAVVSTPPAATVAVGQSTSFTVTFVVNAATAFNFGVSIPNNVATKDPYNWTVNGTGIASPEFDVTRAAAPVASGGTDNLGSAAAGTAASFTYTLANIGSATLNITGTAAITGTTNCTVTVLTAPPATIGSSGSAPLVLEVTPLAAGSFGFTVSIVNDDLDENPYTWTATGTATSSGGGGGGGGKKGGGGCNTTENSAAWLVLAVLFASCGVALRVRRRKA